MKKDLRRLYAAAPDFDSAIAIIYTQGADYMREGAIQAVISVLGRRHSQRKDTADVIAAIRALPLPVQIATKDFTWKETKPMFSPEESDKQYNSDWDKVAKQERESQPTPKYMVGDQVSYINGGCQRVWGFIIEVCLWRTEVRYHVDNGYDVVKNISEGALRAESGSR